MKTLSFAVLLLCGSALALLVADRYLIHPVGRFVPIPDNAVLLRMDTTTGHVEQMRDGQWQQIGK